MRPADRLLAMTDASADPPPRFRRLPRERISGWTQRSALIVAWLALIVFFAVKLPGTFFTSANLGTTLGSQAVLVVLTLALLIPLTAGDYDFSVAATLMLSANTVALLNVNRGWPIWAALLAAVAVGLTVGATNGFFAIVFGLDPFIVTLGMGTFIQGVAFWVSGSNNIVGLDAGLANWTIVNRFLNVPVEFYYGLALCIVLWYVFEYTPLGRRLLFVGRGREVSRLSGIHVDRIGWGSLVAAGLQRLPGWCTRGRSADRIRRRAQPSFCRRSPQPSSVRRASNQVDSAHGDRSLLCTSSSQGSTASNSSAWRATCSSSSTVALWSWLWLSHRPPGAERIVRRAECRSGRSTSCSVWSS
jgi:predicted ABC-type sugar transport system permease subunit